MPSVRISRQYGESDTECGRNRLKRTTGVSPFLFPLLAVTIVATLVSSIATFALVSTARFASVFLVVGAATLLAAVLSSFVLYRLVRRIEEPFKGIRRIASRYAEGDFDVSPHLGLNFEYPEISDALVAMAEGLKHKMEVLVRQRNEQKAILAGMVEAVIVLDSNLEIVEANPAAAKLMNVAPETAKGRSLIDLVRNPELHTFARQTLDSGQTRESTIQLSGEPMRHIEVHGTFIRSQPAPMGLQAGGPSERLVLVLHDITKLKNLERIRRDFVANVSHELKTPITSIKGFIETLKEGAASDPVTAARFLDIMEKQTERMEAIIEDLLSLSRLEQSEGRPLATVRFALRPVLQSAMELVSEAARKRAVEVELSADEALELDGSPSLIEQAILNLLDNAVKFSPSRGRVELHADCASNSIRITVRDHGIGIPAKEHPRIFERFYRVDRARSRELGGTGLGLAIVKHIALAHGGEILVDSTPGDGSVFTLVVPQRPNQSEAEISPASVSAARKPYHDPAASRDTSPDRPA